MISVQSEICLTQGAVISPTIFNLFVDDLCELLPAGISLGQYADDIAIWVRSKDPDEAAKLIQNALDIIDEWSSRWRIALEPTKSSSVVFSKTGSDVTRTLTLWPPD